MKTGPKIANGGIVITLEIKHLKAMFHSGLAAAIESKGWFR